MTKGIKQFMAEKTAEAQAAEIIGEALSKAREVLAKAKHQDPEGAIQAILEADAEE